MTNHWVDIKNTDCALIVGSNAAENHPMSFKWIEHARKHRSAKLIVVDPRISRSAAKADIYGRMRSGTDIALFGGLINYALSQGRYNAAYVKNHTNLSYVLDGFDARMIFEGKGTASDYNDFNGEFPGYNAATHRYDGTEAARWKYRFGATGPVVDHNYGTPNAERILDILGKYYARYTPKMVSDITGMSESVFLQIADEYTSTYADGKSGTILYAMGTTQHTVGVQNIRNYAILQLLLGNMGVAGGGINALRGESNVQGSTDMCLLYHILPGYLGVPGAGDTSLGVQTNTSTLKVTSGSGPVVAAAATAGDRAVRVSADLGALGVRTGDRLTNTAAGTSDSNLYTIESIWTDTATGFFYIRFTAGIAVNWSASDTFQVDSSSGINTAGASYLAAKTPGAMAGIDDSLGFERTSADWWQHTPKYLTSLLSAWWGSSQSFTAGGEFCYPYLPKVDPAANYSHISLFEHISDMATNNPSTPQMLMCWGQNPAVGGPDATFERRQLANLDTLVCVDLWETETAAFWKEDPGLVGTANEGGSYADPTVAPANINTTVYLLPAKAAMEKEGSVSNSGRWMQWRYPAQDAGGNRVQRGTARADLDIIHALMMQLKTLYAGAASGDVPGGAGIRELAWGTGTFNDYVGAGRFSATGEVDPVLVAKEINGFVLNNPGTAGASRGSQVESFSGLAADGTTASGNWLYCGVFPEPGADIKAPQTGYNAGNRAAKRISVDNAATGIGLYSDFSWCWPVNRRILYNRASLKPVSTSGTRYAPFAAEKWVVRRDYVLNRWVEGGDVPDGGWAPEEYMPFIMKPEGASHIWGPGLRDGPLPEHYEPAETPLSSHPFHMTWGQGHVLYNPTVIHTATSWSQYDFVANGRQGDAANFPYIGTTYRLVEHWQAGAMTRNLPWLAELQPDVFVEMSEELALILGVTGGSQVEVTTQRNPAQPLKAVALVTKRFKPFVIMGNTYHHVGIPWHFGYRGVAQGSSANLLTPHIGDPNTRIPEYKAFLCNITPV
jgi:anaerobic selenocysteine-containing dehydrogenase